MQIMSEIDEKTEPDLSLKAMQREVHQCARDHGWWDGDPLLDVVDFSGETAGNWVASVLSKLALVHSEVSEAVECARLGEFNTTVSTKGKPEGLPTELADAVIRILDMAEVLGIDIHDAILQKHAYNLTRTHRHGGKLA